MKHIEAIGYVAKYLGEERGFRVVLSEPRVVGLAEEPDVLAFKRHRSTLVEIKVSRADFLADKRKAFREQAAAGVGSLRLYAAPTGMILPADLPERWGLLEITPKGKVSLVVEPRSFAVWNRDGETAMLACAYERAVHWIAPVSEGGKPVHPKVARRSAAASRTSSRKLDRDASEFDRLFPKVHVRRPA